MCYYLNVVSESDYGRAHRLSVERALANHEADQPIKSMGEPEVMKWKQNKKLLLVITK